MPSRPTELPPWRWEIPERFNIAVACTDAHLGTPVADRTAMLVDDATLGPRALTFAALADRSARCAALLAALGVGVGDRVLIRLPNGIEYPVAFFGALRRGAVAVPTSTLLTVDEVLHLAQDSGAVALVTDRATWAAMHAALGGVAGLRHVLLTGSVLGTGMMDPLYRGHTALLWEGPSDAALWPRLIATHAATVFIGVPTVYRQILQKTALGAADVPTLRHCMSAGEHLSDEVLEGWRRRFGLDVYEGLGMTECSYYLCQTHARPIRPGSAGFVQPGHDVRLLDPATWRPVGVDEEGMLCVPRADPALFLRYWNQPEETRLCFHDDWFLTGDYARRDADGYVWFLGRRDDLINTFGYRVSPHEIDRVLRDHPDVADCAATAEEVGPDKVLAVAYVVPRSGSDVTAADVLAYGRQHLAAYKAPRIVYLVDELPRTRNGKVLRRRLSPALARATAGDAEPRRP